ncbi:Beta-galactosidase [Paenibacillus solanacearum]|uniref:Beta-galactosidase n=1 Tax=Paenibacillus solanacearum TaxID=2048548 RepID=A0A916JSZ1_9BACL|nr:sugar-binding domain-containing protein [Paenibacillus solanacearum]CAG7600576.1 Beta-galactosidase [Paenibacillus solanacearum]
MLDYSKEVIRPVISLDGEWRFALDAQEQVKGEEWTGEKADRAIRVPGSWEEQGFGEPSEHSPIGTWKKLNEYTGVAWYAKEIAVPETMQGHRFLLKLAGVRWKSQVWIDGQAVGEEDSLTSEHTFDITPFVRPGRLQQLVVKLDNRMLLPLAESHIHSYHTATAWGGITGGARIEALPPSRIERTAVTPDAASKSVDLAVSLSLDDEEAADSKWLVEVAITTAEGAVIADASVPAGGSGSRRTLAVKLELGEGARLWSDRDPVLYRASVRLKREGILQDEYAFRFGLRSIEAQGKQIMLNGNSIYLRGYVDCCIFPQTGYPVWDLEHYRKQFRTAKEHGFNHVRLHGWTAPAPFWQAADEEGMLVQTELPHWSNFYNLQRGTLPQEVHRFFERELTRIIASLNAHPSFVMLSLGNELINSQGNQALNELIRTARTLDPSRMYTDNAGYGELPPLDREGDYFIPTLNWHTPYHIDNAATPNSCEDYEKVTSLSDSPVIAHEHGQFTMYVRPSEESKYTGVLRPHWLETTRETLEAKRLTDRVDEFIDATGTLLVRALKEAMERARRTPGLAGIQLLDIRDFPGQGHATTGILDVFWDSKGIIEPDAFRQFNDETVLLMRSQGRTFAAGEAHAVELECSHFGTEPLCGATVTWELTAEGRTVRSGSLENVNVTSGKLQSLGRIQLEAGAEETRAQALELRVTLACGEARIHNQWEFWVFPRTTKLPQSSRIWSSIATLRPTLPGADFRQEFGVNWLSHKEEKGTDLAITDVLSRFVLQYVLDGGSAWLMARADNMHDYVNSKFLPIFWNYMWFPLQSGTTMGMVIHDHPLMSQFPHDGKSNWQWYHLVDKTPAICLDSVPQIQPVVEVIDNFNRGKKLAYAFEVKIGKGKLFVSSLRLNERYDIKRPETAYLFQHIVQYLRSSQFDPAVRVSVGELLGLFKLNNRP